MASYSPIANAEIDAESPLTESLFARLRDNPLAIQEGDPTAPNIQTAALADKAVNANKIADATITSAQIAPLTVTGGPGGNIMNSTITALNMAEESSKFDVLGDGGYARLASSFLIQWKRVPVIPADSDTTLTWELPFTTSVAMVIAGSVMSAALPNADNTLHVLDDYTLSQVRVRNEGFAGDETQSIGGWVLALGI